MPQSRGPHAASAGRKPGTQAKKGLSIKITDSAGGNLFSGRERRAFSGRKVGVPAVAATQFDSANARIHVAGRRGEGLYSGPERRAPASRRFVEVLPEPQKESRLKLSTRKHREMIATLEQFFGGPEGASLSARDASMLRAIQDRLSAGMALTAGMENFLISVHRRLIRQIENE